MDTVLSFVDLRSHFRIYNLFYREFSIIIFFSVSNFSSTNEWNLFWMVPGYFSLCACLPVPTNFKLIGFSGSPNFPIFCPTICTYVLCFSSSDKMHFRRQMRSFSEFPCSAWCRLILAKWFALISNWIAFQCIHHLPVSFCFYLCLLLGAPHRRISVFVRSNSLTKISNLTWTLRVHQQSGSG